MVKKVRKLLSKKVNKEQIRPIDDEMIPRFDLVVKERPPARFSDGNTDGIDIEIDSKAITETLCGARIRCYNQERISAARLGGVIEIKTNHHSQFYGLTVAHIVTGGDNDGRTSQSEPDQVVDSTDSSDGDEEPSGIISIPDRDIYLERDVQSVLKSRSPQNVDLLSPISNGSRLAQLEVPEASNNLPGSRPDDWKPFGHLVHYDRFVHQQLQRSENLDWALVELNDFGHLWPNLCSPLKDGSLPGEVCSFTTLQEPRPSCRILQASLMIGARESFLATVNLTPSFLLLPPSTNFIEAYTMRTTEGYSLGQGDCGTWVVSSKAELTGVICARDDEEIYLIPLESILSQIQQVLQADSVVVADYHDVIKAMTPFILSPSPDPAVLSRSHPEEIPYRTELSTSQMPPIDLPSRLKIDADSVGMEATTSDQRMSSAEETIVALPAILLQHLPQNTTPETVRTMLLFARGLQDTEIIPNAYEEDTRFTTAIARFASMTDAFEAQAMLNGKPVPAGQVRMIVDVLCSPTTASVPWPNTMDPMFSRKIVWSVSPQSPETKAATDRFRVRGGKVIDEDSGNDDKMKEPLGYLKSSSAASVHRDNGLYNSYDSLRSVEQARTHAHFVRYRRDGLYSGFLQPYISHIYPPVNPADQNAPCNTLYVGNLPTDTSEDELKAMFSKQRGDKRLYFRTKQNGPMCFVEFEDISLATKALNELYGVRLHNSVKGGIRLHFSKNPLGVRAGQPGSANP
ncbi:uncharacterized protein A1O5_10754 [Cladophialophora psammophila CBS 110553]|uniref:RRM domain-containing protein n=1 Tax=Cladophialophora psammophila CBS 110553 TaxID=1182543 RepID=W9X6Q6_9EURO|nr:uncharacterized protein A1O5_10754 [Cladophialophora psammophila CBS 110553]EXJ66139.1 hypothetical protein A1O5_10754 [Cladophialophora psammophila CBS 110553]